VISFAFFMKAACSTGLSFGGDVVLVATFAPSSRKNSGDISGRADNLDDRSGNYALS
jgi:hypothetical protein